MYKTHPVSLIIGNVTQKNKVCVPNWLRFSYTSLICFIFSQVYKEECVSFICS